MTFFNSRTIILIFILLSSCTSQTLNKHSYNNSAHIKSNKFNNEVKLKKYKINKEKLENLYIPKKLSQSVIFEFRKESGNNS